MLEPLAAFGNATNLSRSFSISVLDENHHEIPIRTALNSSIEILIPRDPNLIVPPMTIQNVTSASTTVHHLIFQCHYLNLTASLPVSAHWEMQPLNTTLAYLLIYRFDHIPQLNSTTEQIDGWQLLCPSGKFASLEKSPSIDHLIRKISTTKVCTTTFWTITVPQAIKP